MNDVEAADLRRELLPRRHEAEEEKRPTPSETDGTPCRAKALTEALNDSTRPFAGFFGGWISYNLGFGIYPPPSSASCLRGRISPFHSWLEDLVTPGSRWEG